MSVTLAVFVSGLLGAVLLATLSASRRAPDPVDPERTERRLVAFLNQHDRLRSIVTYLDRRVAGGVVVVVAFGADH